MKISRSYLMGLGSGLILSALIALIIPPITINFGSTSPPSQQNVTQGEQGTNGEDTNLEETNQEESNQEETNQGTVDGDNGKNNNEVGAEKDSEVEKDIEGEKEPFVIPRGSTASQIADLLLKEGWISSKEEFMAVVKEKDLATKFRAGTYQLSRGLEIEEILAELIH